MHHRALLCAVVGLMAIAGCSRQETVSCNIDVRYSTARSAAPVQIPDDLSPPNESDALRLPPAAGAGGSAVGECLQEPPSFFGESRPFQLEAELSRRERRQARREERRVADGEAPADSPATPPAEPRDPPSDEDRVIEN